MTNVKDMIAGCGLTDHIDVTQFSYNYYQLGLCGEASELLEKLYNVQPDECEIAKELGDVNWYFCRLLFAVDPELKTLRDIQYTGIDIDQLQSDAVAGMPIELNLFNARVDVIAISISAGKIADITKKMVRDNHCVWTEKIQAKVCKELIELFKAVLCCAAHLGMRMSDVVEMNLSKLASRELRGVIGGSGDNR